jgi:hypothetical protein
MSLLYSKIQSIYNNYQEFYQKYIKDFESGMSSYKFNKFRLYFLNLISKVIIIYNIL